MTRALEHGLPRGPGHSAEFLARRALDTRLVSSAPIKPLHVAFPGALSLRLRQAASDRGVLPNVLVNALLTVMLDNNLFDAVLDGSPPERVATGQATGTNGYTRLQNATLYLLAWHSNDFGVARISTSRLARLMHRNSKPGVSGALRSLQKSGLIERAVRPELDAEQAWSLTSAGWDVARELGGFGDGEDEESSVPPLSSSSNSSLAGP